MNPRLRETSQDRTWKMSVDRVFVNCWQCRYYSSNCFLHAGSHDSDTGSPMLTLWVNPFSHLVCMWIVEWKILNLYLVLEQMLQLRNKILNFKLQRSGVGSFGRGHLFEFCSSSNLTIGCSVFGWLFYFGEKDNASLAVIRTVVILFISFRPPTPHLKYTYPPPLQIWMCFFNKCPYTVLNWFSAASWVYILLCVSWFKRS